MDHKDNPLLNMSRAREVVEVKPIRRCSDLLQCVQSQLKIDLQPPQQLVSAGTLQYSGLSSGQVVCIERWFEHEWSA